jgi:anti-sigma factor RsiW
VHEEWTDKLSDYLDGELPDEERRAVDAHVRGCAECTAVLEDLERVIARAQGVASAPRPPAADLWAGIAARIETSPRSVRLPRRNTDEPNGESAKADAPRRVTFTLPQLAAAAVLIAAVSGGVVWSALGRPEGLHYATPTGNDATPAGSSADLQVRHDQAAPDQATASDATTSQQANHVVPVSMADAQYDAAVADLAGALKQGRGRLDAATIAIVEHNLQIIDQAIDQAREALVGDPANTYLSGHLVEARRRKLDLLRRAAALSESN